MRNGTVLAVCGLADLTLGAGAAFAEAAAAGDQLEEVVVTARRHVENLQTTPISITAITAADLEQAGGRGITDISRAAPGLQFDVGGGVSGNSFTSSIYIRGVGQNEYLSTSDPGVGIYIDGVYYARQVGSIFDLLDIDRVEVLRGPQGTLFGKNTIGGALNVTTSRPTDTFSGIAQFTGGQFGRANGAVTVNAPIVPGLLDAKLSMTYKSYDGYGHQYGDIRTSDEGAFIGRGQLLWKPSDDLDFLLSVDGQRRRQHPATQTIISLIPNAGPVGLWNALVGSRLGAFFDESQVTGDYYTSNSTGGSKSDIDTFGASLTGTYRAGFAEFKSITAYRKQHAGYDHDNSASSVGLNTEVADDYQQQFSQEFQATGKAWDNRVEWTAGAYYFTEIPRFYDLSTNFPGIYQTLLGLQAALGPGYAFTGLPAPDQLAVNYTLYDRDSVRSLAGYFQTTFHVTDELALTGGIRFNDEQKKLHFYQYERQTGTYVVSPTEVDQAWDNASPRFDIDYRVTPDILTYISVSEGFKSGGFNGRAQSLELLQPYQPETLWAYETGFKSEFFDHHFRLNAAAYYNDYSNIQLDASTATSRSTLQTLILNGGRATIEGVEVEGLARITPELTANFSTAYSYGKYEELSQFVIAHGVTFGSALPRTPKWTFTVGATYFLPISPEYGSFSIHADYNYRSHVYFEAVNYKGDEQNGYGLANVRLAWDSPDGNYTIAGSITNLTNEHYYANTFGGTINANGAILGFAGPPREWGVQATARF